MNGQEMRTLREQHGMTRRQLADMLGTSPERVRQMERRASDVDDDTELALSELPATEEPPPDEEPFSTRERALTPDDIEEQLEAEEEEKPRRRRRASRKRGLSAWQQEASEKLIALTQGTYEQIEVNGEQVTIPIPGVCALVNRFDPYDAAVLYHGAPGFWVATVKVAPRHPWLKATIDLLTLGGDYNELTRAVAAIAIPIMMHHGMIPIPQPAAPQPSLNGDGEIVP